MAKTKILDIVNDGLNMASDGEYLYIRSLRDFYKYNMKDMSLVKQKTIFNKAGKARTFAINKKYICLLDFCDLYLLDINDLEIIEVIHLGTDLSNDLITVKMDEENAYISMRNGKMISINLEKRLIKMIKISESSSWDHIVYKNTLYIGTVDGKLIELVDSKINRILELGKKNIYSILFYDNMIYTVSQDMTIKKIDKESFSVLKTMKKAVKGMVRIIGIYNNILVIADRGISLWDKDTLLPIERVEVPTGHFNKGVILINNNIIGSDYQSVYMYEL